jgi:hypothetical protein
LGLLLLLVGGGFWLKWERTWTPAKVERALVASLPPGSTRSEVKAWLEARHIYHTDILDLDGNRRSNMLMAEIGDAASELFGSFGEISIYFYFDKDDRLCRHEVQFFDISL